MRTLLKLALLLLLVSGAAYAWWTHVDAQVMSIYTGEDTPVVTLICAGTPSAIKLADGAVQVHYQSACRFVDIGPEALLFGSGRTKRY